MRSGLALLALLPLRAASVEFNRDVRPILSDKCYACHGPDAAAKHVPFRLDSEEAAKADLGGGRRAIVEGNADASELVKRTGASTPALRMPPVSSGLTLSPSEIATLRAWVAEGAKWQKHWSFIPPVRPPVPQVRNAAWPRNPIDSFVLKRLEHDELKPSAEANRETLIRRVTLDLTGLPPTLAEIDAFLADRSLNAYEKVVDRLLASPRYGERMAFRWLDAARYADTNGYQYDGERMMWRWRDWVIDAFNRNLPFDQFALDQIAGDMLPNATLDQKMATGFNRNHRANTEDGIIPEEYAVEYVVDRVETTSAVFLGTTLGLRAVPRSQIRSVHAERVLPGLRVFQQRSGTGPRDEVRQLGAPDSCSYKTAAGCSWPRSNSKYRAAEDSLRKQEPSIARDQKQWEHRLSSSAPVYWAPARDLNAAVSFERDDEAKSESGTLQFAPGRIGRAACSTERCSSIAVPPLASKSRIASRSQPGFIRTRFPTAASCPAWWTTRRAKDSASICDKGKVHVNITSNWTDDAIRMETERALEPNTWHHIAVTYSGSRMAEGIHVYVDGHLEKTRVLLDTSTGLSATLGAGSTSRSASAPAGDRSGVFAA